MDSEGDFDFSISGSSPISTRSRVVRLLLESSKESIPQLRPWGLEKFEPACFEMSLENKSS